MGLDANSQAGSPRTAGITVGADGIARCWWCADDPFYRGYHDAEWGRPVKDDRRLFEKLSLEGFQSGLSWLTILRKRENFRMAFKDFNIEAVARFNARRVDRLLKDAGIVRNRAKIEATINNARRCMELIEEFGSFAGYVWRFEPDARSRPPNRRLRDPDADRGEPGIEGDEQGSEAPRVVFRRSHHGVLLHGGDGARE